MSSRLAVLIVSCLVACGSQWAARRLVADDALKPDSSSASEKRISAALDETRNWNFIDQPLADVLDSVGETHDIPIVIDVPALEDYGIGQDTPVTFVAQGMRLRSFLRNALRPLDLTWSIRNDTLWVTTPEVAECHLSTKTYRVGDLIRVRTDPGESAYDYHSLIDAITSCIAADSWDNVGGPGTIEGIYGSLVVSQTEDVHDWIGLFLAGYRKVIQQREQAATAVIPVFINDRSGIHDHIRAALEQPVTLEFIELPLADVVRHIAKQADIALLLDTLSMDDVGIGSDIPITVNVKNIPLRNALRRILHELDMTFVVRNEALIITTPETCESELSTILHPVHDLVAIASTTDEVDLEPDFDTLLDVITTSIEADSWDAVGGPGTIVALTRPPILAISQTDDVHERILALLRRLRVAKQAEKESLNGPTVDMPHIVLRKTTQAYALTLDAKGQPIHPGEQVVTFITRAVEPESWDGEEGNFVMTVGNSVVVRHTNQVQREIQQLLQTTGIWGYGYGPGTVGRANPDPNAGGGMGGFGGGGLGGESGGFFHITPR